MVGALHGVLHEVVERVVALDVGAGRDLVPRVVRERRLGKDLPREPDAGPEVPPVVLVGHVVEEDRGCGAGLGRGQSHAAARFRAHRPHVGLEAVALGGGLAVVAHGEGQEVVLDVRVLHAGAGADEAAGFEVVGGAEAIPEQEPARADQALGDKVPVAVERDRLAALHLQVDLQMVLQVGADAGPVGDHIDAVLLQVLAGADAGEHENLRRVDGGRREDDLAPGADAADRAAGLVLDAGGAPAFDDHPANVGVGLQPEVAALHRRLEIGIGG